MTHSTRRISLFTFGLLLVAVVCYARQTRPAQESEREVWATIDTLKRDLNELAREQRQIRDELSILKQLTGANGIAQHTAQPNQPPSTLDLGAAELFQGNLAAPIAIVEYGDFECPYCVQYQHEISSSSCLCQ